MDLKELKDLQARRHPWETARLKAVKRLLKGIVKEELSVLDVGCGDGFVIRELFRDTPVKGLTGVDINLSARRIRELAALGGGITYLKKLPEKGRWGLVLLLDVIEHVKDDRHFLKGLVKDHLEQGGRVLITAPAFQTLYGPHDRFLGHFRRYSLGELSSLASSSGLKVASSGYLFTSLIAPKFIKNIVERWTKSTGTGIGNWGGGPLLTAAIDSALSLDRVISSAIAKAGIKLPGLTVWVLCERQR